MGKGFQVGDLKIDTVEVLGFEPKGLSFGTRTPG
jgi:hypothetical protein